MDDLNWKEIINSTLKKEIKTLIQSLLDDGLDVNALIDGTTMLSCAAKNDDLDTIEFLIEKGADGNVANSDGSKPIHIAAKHGRKDVVKFFLNLGMFVDSCDNDKCTPLHYVSALRVCLSSDTRESYREIVHCLVDSNADLNAVNRKGCTPLLFAARCARKDIVELFIELGADVECHCNGTQWTVLHYACCNGWLDVVKYLASRGCDLNSKTSKGHTPLIKATHSAWKDIVKLLIESGANVNCRDSGGVTVLHYACVVGWLDVVKSLINKGCDIHAQDTRGNTPLFFSATLSNPHVVECLIDSGADVKSCDKAGRTLLHYACENGWFNVVKSLVNKGCDLNAKDYAEEKTPLHVAVHTRNLGIIEHLLKQGADFNIKNFNGETAFNNLLHGPLCLDGIVLFIENGAYFQSDDYVAISEKPLLKKGILQDTQLCTRSAVNKFNNGDLPKIYKIPVLSKSLPPIEKLKIASNSNVAQDIIHSVEYEIQSKGNYNVSNVSLVALSILSVGSLVEHYENLASLTRYT